MASLEDNFFGKPLFLVNLLIIMENIEKRTDSQFYKLGKWIWIPCIVLGLFGSRYIYPYISDGKKLFCVFYKVMGLPCPGCGGTRALVSLFKLDFVSSFLYNPSVLYLVFAYLEFMFLYFYRKNISKTILYKKIHIERYAYVFIFVIIFQWILKLVFHFFKISFFLV